MDHLQQVLQEIEKRNSFVVTSHARPDGDSIGSSLAMAQVLRGMGKRADVVLADTVPVLYQPLPDADKVFHSAHANGHYEAAIVLECDSAQRTRVRGLDRYFQISIDHHASSRPWADLNWVDPTACAVGEMVFRLALASKVKITPEIATCLYAAVLTDTGSFSYSSTNVHTFELARYLVEYGAQPAEIAQNVYYSSPLAKMRLLGAALTSLDHEGAMTWMHVTRADMERCGAMDEDCEGLVNYALGIAGVEVAVFFREIANERVRVSIRSKGGVNVAAIAEEFGGGGHECAAGFSVEGPEGAAIERVLSELRLRMPRSSE
ncbi:MAG TPA: bifunctional oligoribonuclease/PAP phosphatase NrnA [Candidatus Angelobacter sp.]|nr:bifunctional oligoribonuclease/PAP phosphatase NrnA [Candidatus Angelobacter sp.]